VRELSAFSAVTVLKKKAVVAIVGQNMRNYVGTPGLVFEVLRREGINAEMISVGASKINISFVIANADIKTTIRTLHKKFFEDNTPTELKKSLKKKSKRK